MSRSVMYREKAGPGPILRATGTASSVVLSGLDPETAYEFDVGDGTWREETTLAAPGDAVPDAFAADQWALLSDGTIRVYALPSATPAITDLEYRVDTGSGFGAWTSLSGSTSGDYATGLEIGDIAQIRARNSISPANDGENTSDSKTVGNQIFYVPSSVGDLTSRWVSITPGYDAGPPPFLSMASATQARRFLSLDAQDGVSLASLTNVKLYAEYEFATPVNDPPENRSTFGLVIRGAGAAGTETAWVARHTYVNVSGYAGYAQDIALYDAGTFTSDNFLQLSPPPANTRHCMRVDANGNTKQAKFWLKSVAEPEAWTREETGSAVAGAGRIGLFHWQRGLVRAYCLGVGLNGAAAPRPLA